LLAIVLNVVSAAGGGEATTAAGLGAGAGGATAAGLGAGGGGATAAGFGTGAGAGLAANCSSVNWYESKSKESVTSDAPSFAFPAKFSVAPPQPN